MSTKRTHTEINDNSQMFMEICLYVYACLHMALVRKTNGRKKKIVVLNDHFYFHFLLQQHHIQ